MDRLGPGKRMIVRHAHLGVAVAVGLAVAPLSEAPAGEADVVAAEAVRLTGGGWRFDVSVAHDDTGWDHYADRWDIVTADGTVLGSRVLLHPHVGEQPFTRSLGDVAIPPGIDAVILRARDSVHGLGGAELTVTLNR